MDIHLDFETRSACDLKAAGGWRYAEDSTTEILCLGYAIDNTPARIWIPESKNPPADIIQYMADPDCLFHAWNAEFEMAIWRRICVERLGWPEIPLDQWRDTMAQAAAMALPLSLDEASTVMGTSRKDPAGKRLISQLCKPGKNWYKSKAELFELYNALYNYCKQDVEVEREISRKLPPTVGKELDFWRHCAIMNHRGVPVCKAEVSALVDQVAKIAEKMNARTPVLTNGAATSVTQVQKLTEWLSGRLGRQVNDLTKATVTELLASPQVAQDARAKELLTIRQKIGKSSTAKLNKALVQLCADGRIRNNFVYHGADTGRNAGRGFQMQNLPARGVKIQDVESVISDFMVLDNDVLSLVYDIIPTASALIRSMLKAPKGYILMAGDFKSIEAFVTPWLANEGSILRAIREGLDLYKAMASEMFKVSYGSVTKEQRQMGKVGVLACGFAGGRHAFLNMASNYGITIEEEEAQGYVTMFRAARPMLVNCWHAFSDAAMTAMTTSTAEPVLVNTNGGPLIKFYRTGDNLKMWLPSGRELNYPMADVREVETPWGSYLPAVTYMTTNSKTHKWERRSMTGGNFFQNAVQGIARDALMEAQLRLEERGYPILLSVHDESAALVPEGKGFTLKEFLDTMGIAPPWATGLPLSAEGWEGKRYRK